MAADDEKVWKRPDWTPEESITMSPVLEDLTTRAKTLLSELDTFKKHLCSIRQEATVEIVHYRGTCQSELSMLERLAQIESSQAASHVARSSNLPFLETVWSTAKSSGALVALQKRIYFDPPGGRPSKHALACAANGSQNGKQKRLKSRSTVVDAITEGGRAWTKVSLVTNTRLLFDLAKQGWESGGSGSEDEEGRFPDTASDDDSDVPILKTAKELAAAAASTRVKTWHPTVTLILPRIAPAEQDEIDKVIEDCRAAGVTVKCGQDSTSVPGINEILHNMAPEPFSRFSDTLNVDCTLLLALVSEFSHARVNKEPWFHKALQRQVEIEDNENLLPSLLYPAMTDHDLVCTKEAAKRMREIVDTIGTPSEKARTAIMMGDEPDKSPENLTADMQEWSAYEVPATWRLPIQIVHQDENDCLANLPTEAHHVSREQTDINKSVFLHGWATGRTTITSNRSVVKQLEAELDKFEDLDPSIWPSIWLCPTARSLVGKEKRGAKKEDEKEGVWPMPDPLRREEQRRNGLDVLSIREGHQVEDLRPEGYAYLQDAIDAKNASER